jgi:hypothetical protein
MAHIHLSSLLSVCPAQPELLQVCLWVLSLTSASSVYQGHPWPLSSKPCTMASRG